MIFINFLNLHAYVMSIILKSGTNSKQNYFRQKDTDTVSHDIQLWLSSLREEEDSCLKVCPVNNRLIEII